MLEDVKRVSGIRKRPRTHRKFDDLKTGSETSDGLWGVGEGGVGGGRRGP